MKVVWGSMYFFDKKTCKREKCVVICLVIQHTSMNQKDIEIILRKNNNERTKIRKIVLCYTFN